MTARLLAPALAIAMLALAAPAWPCGPPGSMDNNGGGQGSNANNGGMGGQGQGDNAGGASNWNNNNAGGANANGDSNGGRGDTWDNSGGENARQGASNQANSDLGDDNNGGSRRSGGGQNQNGGADYSNQIGAAGQEQAASDAIDCAKLRQQLDALTSETAPVPGAEATKFGVYIGRVMQMTPAMLDQQIIAEQAKLDEERARDQQRADMYRSFNEPRRIVPKRSSGTLDFLLQLRAARLAHVGEDGMQRRADQIQANVSDTAFQLRAERDQKIRDLQSQLANLNCPTHAASPSPSPSPESQ